MQTFSAPIQAGLNAGRFSARNFFSITARDRDTDAEVSAYYWNDLGPTTYNVTDGKLGTVVARNFSGSGTLITVSPIILTNDMTIRRVTVILNTTNDEIDTYVRTYDLKNAYVEIHRGLFDPTLHIPLDTLPKPKFTGFVDGCSIRSPSVGQGGAVELRCVSHQRELTRAGYAVRSHENQLSRDPADNFLKYTSIISTVPLFWNEEKVKPPETLSKGGFTKAAFGGGA